MTLVHRVLPPSAVESLAAYEKAGGGRGLANARAVEPVAIIDEIEASGLRGRGGAGFPTGRKWRTVAENRSPEEPATVVVNGAEGEPGTLKDRAIMRLDPYEVLEGALIAARAIGADNVIVAVKHTFTVEAARLRAAAAELAAAGWFEGVRIDVFEGPDSYLYGEETALMEAIDGRPPFPRIAPPFRRGVDEVVETPADVMADSGLSAHIEMAGPSGSGDVAAPTLVNNVETMSNVARIIARGAAWFRTEGTDRSPGTIVCTVTGDVVNAGVGEVILGTPLRQVIDDIGGGPRDGRRVKAVLTGVSNRVVTADELDTPLTYEDFQAAGTWLGSASFIVFDDAADMVAVAAGASRFLAVESCGQCVPCKFDGVELAATLAKLAANDAEQHDLDVIRHRVDTVADRARCTLAGQHQAVVGSILDVFGAEVDAHLHGRAEPAEPVLVTELRDIEEGVARWDDRHREKQPDWTYDAEWSGSSPADLDTDHRR
jgi:NADH:ubiquinone oxidoreductase subunit F (NADH-binding)